MNAVIDFLQAARLRKNNTKPPHPILAALDELALALANHGHRWTERQHDLYETAVAYMLNHNIDAMESKGVVATKRLALLLGVARQYRVAEKTFNAVAIETKGEGALFQAAAVELTEARDVFEQMIGMGEP